MNYKRPTLLMRPRRISRFLAFLITSLTFSAESSANENIIAKAPQSKENIQLYTNAISDIIDRVEGGPLLNGPIYKIRTALSGLT